MTFGQHVPSANSSKSRRTGVHWAYRIIALATITRFIEMMMNRVSHLIHPAEMRRIVIPNDVLLQAIPRIVAKPAAYEYSATTGMFSRTMSSKCSPMP